MGWDHLFTLAFWTISTFSFRFVHSIGFSLRFQQLLTEQAWGPMHSPGVIILETRPNWTWSPIHISFCPTLRSKAIKEKLQFSLDLINNQDRDSLKWNMLDTAQQRWFCTGLRSWLDHIRHVLITIRLCCWCRGNCSVWRTIWCHYMRMLRHRSPNHFFMHRSQHSQQ